MYPRWRAGLHPMAYRTLPSNLRIEGLESLARRDTLNTEWAGSLVTGYLKNPTTAGVSRHQVSPIPGRLPLPRDTDVSPFQACRLFVEDLLKTTDPSWGKGHRRSGGADSHHHKRLPEVVEHLSAPVGFSSLQSPSGLHSGRHSPLGKPRVHPASRS